ncbi:hypothetical protein JTE90_007240 [Oedothorax gibbosus]|uniref:Damage-specific DNA-binding protein 2 n=1 Tax=Oedothorax gibbosus TaxID=931172 RepID=A0AAV6VL13_9ARAC|nr:hypothetical protein JTE90_007240 [Oedothorax gibbosus]
MGPPRKCNQNKSLPLLNDANRRSITRNLREKKMSKEEVTNEGNQTDQLQNTLSKKVSVFKYLNTLAYGDRMQPEIKTFTKSCIISHLNDLDGSKLITPFEKRVTALQWHPKYPSILAAASKWGELLLFNVGSKTSNYISGIGAGGSIVGLKFTLDDQCSVYTASITGKIRRESFSNSPGKTFLSTNCYQNWFTSLDVCKERKLLLAGDCKGNGILLSTDEGQRIWPHFKRLHTDKVSHIEFCTLDTNLFVTASIDHSVKIWDLRNLCRSVILPEPVHTFLHLKGVNSAYFSPSNRCSLLTTDQHSEIRVYKSPDWSEQLVIKHPHRHFQHISPIKAVWHPLEDIVVVGRFPDDEFKKSDVRTIDYYDGSTGNVLRRFRSGTGGIVVLNGFNSTGDCLASASGCSITFKSFKNKLTKIPDLHVHCNSSIVPLY